MDNPIWIIIAAAAVVVLAAVAWFYLRSTRSKRLRAQFGPEYDRVLQEEGHRRRAEAVLERRHRRVSRLVIRPLTRADRDRFAEEWRLAQARFVDDPPGALTEADQLVSQVMNARGYPMADFEQRAEDVSVDHPRVVENYRAAHSIAARSEAGRASTEDLRAAMVHYRALFEDLLAGGEPIRKAG